MFTSLGAADIGAIRGLGGAGGRAGEEEGEQQSLNDACHRPVLRATAQHSPCVIGHSIPKSLTVHHVQGLPPGVGLVAWWPGTRRGQ